VYIYEVYKINIYKLYNIKCGQETRPSSSESSDKWFWDVLNLPRVTLRKKNANINLWLEIDLIEMGPLTLGLIPPQLLVN
jgi:hypothetical protein